MEDRIKGGHFSKKSSCVRQFFRDEEYFICCHVYGSIAERLLYPQRALFRGPSTLDDWRFVEFVGEMTAEDYRVPRSNVITKERSPQF